MSEQYPKFEPMLGTTGAPEDRHESAANSGQETYVIQFYAGPAKELITPELLEAFIDDLRRWVARGERSEAIEWTFTVQDLAASLA